MMNNGKLLGITLLAFGLTDVLYINDLFNVTYMAISGYVLLLYGIMGVYFNLGWNERGWLFLSNVAFFVGLSIIIHFYFRIKNADHLFFTIFLFTLANGFLLLFIENIKEKKFLAASLILFFLSFISGKITDLLGKFSILADLGWMLLGYWPIFLILFGTAVLAGRRK